MNDRTSDGIMDSTEESILRTCAGLSITDGGISIQNSELPRTVTQTGDPENDVSDNASSESETIKVTAHLKDGYTEMPGLSGGVVINTDASDNASSEAETIKVTAHLKDGYTEMDGLSGGVVNSDWFSNYKSRMESETIKVTAHLKEDGEIPGSSNDSVIEPEQTRQFPGEYYCLEIPNLGITYPTDGVYRFTLLFFGYSSESFENYYFNPDSSGYPGLINTSEKFIDAEKVETDSSLDWGAVAANNLFYTGWITSNKRDEDTLFDSFRTGFTQHSGGEVHYGYEWYLCNQYSAELPYDQPFSSGGMFLNALSSSNVSDYYCAYSGFFENHQVLLYLFDALDKGTSVSIGYGLYDSNGLQKEDYVTLWGFYVDDFDSPLNSSFFRGIIVSDPADCIVASGGTASLAPNRLRVLPIEWDANSGTYIVNPNYSYDVEKNGIVYSNCTAKINYYSIIRPGDYTTIKNSNGVIFCMAAAFQSKTINIDSMMYISSAGLAMDTTVTSGGIQNVLANGTALDTVVSSGGIMNVSSGGSACNIHASSGAILGLTVAPDTYVSGTYGGSAFVISSSTISGYTVHSGCKLDVLSGGTATSTTVSSGGIANVLSGGTATNITAENGASLGITVASNTSAQGTYNSNPFVMSSASISNYTVHSGCWLDVLSGGSINNINILSGGRMRVSGPMTITGSAGVSTSSGAIVDFDISNLAPANTAMVNDLSLIQGTPIYTLTVSISQTNVTYSLAGGASSYDQSLSVHSQDGSVFGTLALDATAGIMGVNCTLSLNNGVLSFEVGDNTLQETVPQYFNGKFSGGSAIFAAQDTENSSVDFYAGGSSWGTLPLGSGWTALGAGDFNDDDVDDVLRINDEGYVMADLSNGDGTFSSQMLNLKGIGWCVAGIGDFNDNGTDDVLLANPSASSMTTGLIGYWESGTTWTLIDGYSNEWEVIATGDFNGDGKCDMLWKKSFQGYDSYCSWLVGVDANVTAWNLISNSYSGWNFLCVGDFDGDDHKTADIALINGSGEVGIWGVSGGTMSSWTNLGTAASGWEFAGVGDFNGDGTDDIAWRNSSGGLTGYWQINSLAISSWQNIAVIA